MNLVDKKHFVERLSLLAKLSTNTEKAKRVVMIWSNSEKIYVRIIGDTFIVNDSFDGYGADIKRMIVDVDKLIKFVKTSVGIVSITNNGDYLEMIDDDGIKTSLLNIDESYMHITNLDYDGKVSTSFVVKYEYRTKLLVALKSVDNHNPKYELNSMLFDVKNGAVNVVSTDTRRLFYSKISKNVNTRGSGDVMIPKPIIDTVLKIMKSGYDSNVMRYSNYIDVIKVNTTEIIMKKVFGKYPAYDRIIPKEIGKKFKLESAPIIKRLKRLQQSAKDCEIVFNGRGYEFKTIDDDAIVERSKTSFSGELLESSLKVGEEVKFLLNIQYILDAIAESNGEFEIGFNASNVPIVIETGVGYKIVIMTIALH